MEPIDIISKSVEVHGGFETWQEMKSLSFTKKALLYHEDGSLKKEVVQEQKFHFEDDYSASIHSLLDSVSYHLRDGKVYLKTKDSLVESQSKQSMFASALYVTSQPFQLIESGATFERKQDTLFGNSKVYAIDIHYKGDTSTSDQWTYYFDQTSFKVVACRVKHGDRVSMIENTSYDSSTPFLFNATRTSTIMNGGKPNFVIAEYEYSKYEVEFD